MQLMETGITGAKVQSWREANPRSLLERIVSANPNWSDEQIRSAMEERLLEPSAREYLSSVILFWTRLNLNSIRRGVENNPAKREAAITATRAMADQLKEKVVATVANFIFLEMKLPNGKLLGDCTGVELGKMGSAFSGIAKVANWQIVRKVLTEAQIKKLYSAHT